MEIFKLFGSIFVDNSEANNSIQKTGEAAEKSGGLLSKLGGFAEGAAKAVAAISGAAVSAATAIGGIAMNSAEAGDRVDKMSQKLGLTREGFQEWDYVLAQNGASIDSFGTGMKTLQQKMVDLGDDGKAAKELFDGLGLSLDEVSQMSPEDAMGAVIKRLQEMPEGAEKADLALQAFGKQGMELMPLLNQTAEGTEELRKRAHELGLVMSDEAVDAGVTFGDTLDDAKKMIGGLANTMGAELLPSMTSGLEAFIGFVQGADGAEEKMHEAFDGIVSVITEMMPELLDRGAKIALSLLKGLTNALPSLVSGVMEIIPTIITTIIEMLPDVLQAGIEVLAVFVTGIADALPNLIPVAVDAVLTLVETLIENVDLLIDAAIAITVALAEGLINATPRLIEKVPLIIMSLVSAITENLPKILKLGVLLLVELVKGIVKSIPELVAAVPKIIGAVVAGFLKGISEFFSIGKDIVKGVWEGITAMGTWIKDKVQGFFNGIVSGVKGVLGIKSPSKVFAEMGKFTGEGFVNGVESTANKVKQTMDSIFSYMPDVDYQELINKAVEAGDYIEAAYLEMQRNLKIEREGLERVWEQTFDYASYLPKSLSSEDLSAVYDSGIDYQTVIDSAVEAGDYIKAAQLEFQRNLKIEREGLGDLWEQTFNYVDYLPKALSGGAEAGKAAGDSIIESLTESLDSNNTPIYTAERLAIETTDALSDAINKADIQKTGETLAEKFAKGIERGITVAESAVKKLLRAVETALGANTDTAFSYQPEVDYQALINDAVAKGDFDVAARLEIQRNLKIETESLGELMTHNYAEYQPKSFAGSAQGDGSLAVYIQNMNVRDDNDIHKIARELYLLQERGRRAGAVFA